MKITPLTRRDIIDAISVEKINWAGRLDETDFLARLFDLSQLPSHDSRFDTIEGDIWQHRVNNYDWDDDWVFSDSRFNIKNGDDEIFLRFLCEMVHPVVRPDPTEVAKLVQLFNQYLSADGFHLVEKSRMSGRPIYAGRYVGVGSLPGVSAIKEVAADLTYVAQQITRMESAVNSDPDLAIGTAKELVEACCATILEERGVDPAECEDLPQLVKRTSKELKLTPDDIPNGAKAAQTIRKLLSNLASITHGVAELRNAYGTGHGRAAKKGKGLTSRHAKLAVGAASTLAVFLIETHDFKKPPSSSA